MRKLFIFLLLVSIAFTTSAQQKIVGKFASASETFYLNMHIGPGSGSSHKVPRSYLLLDGKQYDLFRYSKKEIDSMKNFGGGGGAQQIPLNILFRDYYFTAQDQLNDKYCLFEGIVEGQSVYSTSLIEYFDERKIIEALKKCNK